MTYTHPSTCTTDGARCVSWDTLPDLTAADDLAPVSLAPQDAQAAHRQAITATDGERSRQSIQGYMKTQIVRLASEPDEDELFAEVESFIDTQGIRLDIDALLADRDGQSR